MANIKFPRKEFEKAVGKINEEMQEKIALFGTPFESLNEQEIEIEIFPNRPDLYSLQGYLRSFLAFLNKKTGLKQYKLEKPEKDYEVNIEKYVKEIRPYTACAIVKNLKFDNEKIKEIIDIQEKLHATLGRNRKKIAIGIYPLEKIKLPITYTAKNSDEIKFIPLEAEKEMTGLQILKQHPVGREYSHLLQGKEKFPIFIDAAGEILSMPPIINSNKTGKITEATKEVFIECSGFDFNILKKTLNILTSMLADMNGEIYHFIPEKLNINLEDANKLLGLSLNEKQVKNLLEKMTYNYKDNEVEIPPWRTDILHPVDIYEDIAIAYGYNNFEPEIPQISTIGEESEKEIKKRKISEILSGLQLLEIKTHHLLTKEDIKKLKEKAEIEVENSKTDYKILRTSLLPSTLKILSENVDSEYPQKIFEIGKVFERDENQEAGTSKLYIKKDNFDSVQNLQNMGNSGIKEKEKLSIALTPSNFTELRQVLEYLGRMLNISLKTEETKQEKFIEGRTGKILKNSKEIGILGEIYPSVLKSFHLKMPLAYLELSLDELI